MIRKHSATLHGHRTSFSLEAEFFDDLKSIANARGLSLAALIAEVDDARSPDSNLSSALRLYVLGWVKAHGAPVETRRT
ncbi:putative DNA-binding ribbon-helix-helix protein [Neorhizobium galegae]|uniref:ribbon-helix-helix domain-containing protein n=1 Tax=Neorhizobium galegae TaxID=399 RepID=UPI001AE78E06|nr:putative DNA-binding ribbon-helix-helix protein [Neorhizobium galegae]